MGEYNHKAIESKWQSYWATNKTFRTPESLEGKKKLYVLDMFPYPSGSGLHIGHPLGYTGTDIYSRMKRMQGYAVLHPMGWDAFGLPAEQHAVATGEHPAKVTEENCRAYRRQLQNVGLSYDWDREIATCTPQYYHWTQWIFLKLYNSWFDSAQQKARPIEELSIPAEIQEQGEKSVEEFRAAYRLAYLADALVNWCPALGTVLANEEVIDGRSERGDHEVIRKPMRQWMLRITKYADRLIDDLEGLDWPESIKEQQRNWIGKSFGTEIEFWVPDGPVIPAYTTRPDTLFGVTFFVVSPEHPVVKSITTAEQRVKVEKYCENAFKLSDFARTVATREKTGVFTGSYVRNPATGQPVPVYVGDYVLMTYGTGAVMGVPAHDERDYDFARKFQLEVRPVLAPEKESEELYQSVIEGEAVWTGAGIMLPCMHDVAKELKLEGKRNKDAGELITNYLISRKLGKRVVNYKLRDWLFSRQRYWGEPIPIVHWDGGYATPLSESELPLTLPVVEDYKPSTDGESPLAKAIDWLYVSDPKRGRGRRETNTMPQWAGSCWYYLRFIDPENKTAPWDPAREKDWMAVDLYVGGAEHAVLHLLYSRFWHKVLFDLGFVSTKEPFQKLFNQGMIQAPAYKDRRGALVPVDQVKFDEQGHPVHTTSGERLDSLVAKMSKSLRNVVSLESVVKEYGADTLRMFLMFLGPLESSRIWDSRAITGTHRFLKRVWQLTTAQRDSGTVEFISEGEESLEVKRAINRAIKKITEDVEVLAVNTCISTLMECVNMLANAKLSRSTAEKLMLILSPFAPHVTEEIWERLGHSTSISLQAWPEYDPQYLKQETVPLVIQVNGRKRAVFEVDATIDEAAMREAVVSQMSGTEYQVMLSDKFIFVYQSGTKIPKLVNVIRAA